MIEQIIDVISYFFIIERAFRQDYTLAFEFSVIAVWSAVYDDFFESVVELDLLFADFQRFNFEFPFTYEIARESCSKSRTLSFVTDHDDLTVVVEQCAHSLTQVTQGIVDEYEVNRSAAAIRVEILEFADQVLAECIMELICTVGVLVVFIELFEQEHGLHLQLDRTAVICITRWCFAANSWQVTFFESVFDNWFDALEVGFNVFDAIQAVEELSV